MLKFKKKKTIKPLSFYFYTCPFIFLILAGVIDSIYLAVIHYRNYTDISYKSFCAISKAINCDTVAQSSYSIFWGMPVAVWGIIGYVFLLLLVPFIWDKSPAGKRMWGILLIVTFIFSCCSIVLALISIFHIHSYCIMCVLSYCINLMLLFYCWLIRRRFDDINIVDSLKYDVAFLWRKKIKVFPLFFLFIISVNIIWLIFPDYWKVSLAGNDKAIPTGLTEEGHPWIGAEKPVLIITEYSDYMCFQCRKMHFFLRQLIGEYPGKIRLVHRNYPMDHEFNPTVVPAPFHVGSGNLSLLALRAAKEGKFWEANDFLYGIDKRSGVVDINTMGQQIGVDARKLSAALRSPYYQKKLSIDIFEGMRLMITGTPSYVVNGQVFQGQIPQDIINRAIK